ncbi:MAG: transporter suffix domain-containing protein [Myxococcota bacterium]|nr:transporter suffix domain-containing protein [Myxococcota bacterium]
MHEPDADHAVADATAPPPGWRFRAGVAVFVLGFLAPLAAPLVALTGLPTAAKATLGGLLLVGIPEICTVAAIAILGKPGFATVKARVFGLLRRYGPPKEVGKVRYYVGLAMLLPAGIYAWAGIYLPEVVPGYAEHRVPIALTLDALWFSSFFVLGADFWDKVRALFLPSARAQFGS